MSAPPASLSPSGTGINTGITPDSSTTVPQVPTTTPTGAAQPPQTTTPTGPPQAEEETNTTAAISAHYSSPLSRLTWDILCHGNRHFGYYPSPTTVRWPFPLSRAQSAMQTQLLTTLSLPPGSHVLDAGCGDAHVAADLAVRGSLRITAFDIVERHCERARAHVRRAGAAELVEVRRMGFDDLKEVAGGVFDGVYTSEALLHARDPRGVVREFWRVLKPGGRVVLHEFHHDFMGGRLVGFPAEVKAMAVPEGRQGEEAAGSAFLRAREWFEGVVTGVGFEDVVVRNYSPNIEPMAKLLSFFVVVKKVVVALRLQKLFSGVMARGEYVGQEKWAYVSVSGTKPRGTVVE